jgi:hypothetical protein
MPRERFNSLVYARDFLRSLLDPKLTPRVPLDVRREARYRLKHYPNDWEMEQIRQALPELFGNEGISEVERLKQALRDIRDCDGKQADLGIWRAIAEAALEEK